MRSGLRAVLVVCGVVLGLGIHALAVHLLLGRADDRVEPHPVVALDALLKLGVDVEGHLRVGMPDLAHDPLDIDAVGEERDRDVAYRWR